MTKHMLSACTAGLTAFLVLFSTSTGHAFDPAGGRWIQFRRQAPQTDILGIYADGSDTIHVAATGRYHRYDGTRWNLIPGSEEDLNTNQPFYFDTKGWYYLLDDGYLVKYREGELVRLAEAGFYGPVSSAVMHEDTLYMASYNISGGGLYAYDGNVVAQVAAGRARSVTVDNGGRLWCTILEPGGDAMQLIRLEDGQWRDMSTHVAELYTGSTSSLTVRAAPDGSVWVNNLGDYGVYRDGAWTLHTAGAGVAPYYLHFGGDGSVWGFGGNTLYRLTENEGWTVSLSLNTFVPNQTSILASTSDGSCWTFDGSRVYRYENGQWEEFICNRDLGSDTVTSMAFTEYGDLICGHGIRYQDPAERENIGISIYQDGEWRTYNEIGGSRIQNVYQLEQMPTGEVMGYGDNGFFVHDGFSFSYVDSIYIENPTDMAWTDEEVMWITALMIGLIRFEDKVMTVFVPFDDLPAGVGSLNVDNDILYMNMGNGSVISFDTDMLAWDQITTPEDDLNRFVRTEDGVFWAAMDESLSRWSQTNPKWTSAVAMQNARVVEIGPDGKIWSSGYDNTGYLENDEWHRLEELAGYAADCIAFDEWDGRVAVNAFDENREKFDGLFLHTSATSVENEATAPEPFIRTANHPNPFNPVTTITFTLPEPGDVTVEVYSATGQHVSTLVSGWFPAGRSSVRWNAETGAGHPCASGVYFYRVELDDRAATGKMLLIR